MSDRAKDIERFYTLLAELEKRVGGKRKLADCHWNMGWPHRGVYFFFEDGETRTFSPDELRVVRVGTHAVTARSKSRLWNRLYEHKQDGGRSVFRDHVNRSLRNRSRKDVDHRHTHCISKYIGRMPFLWVNVDGDDSHLLRTRLERNAIALLSNWNNHGLDRHSPSWLGLCSGKTEIKSSGLWNVQHAKSGYKRSFLDDFKDCIEQTDPLTEPGEDWDRPVCLLEDEPDLARVVQR